MATIKLYIALNNLSELMPRYDAVQVHRATAYDGTFTEITTAATRPRLEGGKALYLYYDESGDPDYWYKIRLVNTSSLATSEFSEPTKGDEVESLAGIMTPEELKSIFLTGVDLTDDKGNPYPDAMFDFAIRSAIGWVEAQLDIEARPAWHVDRYDFDSRLWQEWGMILLDHYPILEVDYVKMYWPSAQEAYDFPDEWIVPDYDGGQINLIPTSGTLAQAMAISGTYLPTVLTTVPYIPRALEVRYRSGWEIGTLPHDLREMIGKRSCFPILNTAGDLIAGAGIANFSISMDGLSQSIGTTSSATNSGYGARLKQFESEIRRDMPVLRRFYKNVGLRVA